MIKLLKNLAINFNIRDEDLSQEVIDEIFKQYLKVIIFCFVIICANIICYIWLHFILFKEIVVLLQWSLQVVMIVYGIKINILSSRRHKIAMELLSNSFEEIHNTFNSHLEAPNPGSDGLNEVMAELNEVLEAPNDDNNLDIVI